MCVGRITLSLRTGRHATGVGGAAFRIPAQDARTVRIRLSPLARRRLAAARHHALTVSALITSLSGRRTVQLTMTMRVR